MANKLIPGSLFLVDDTTGAFFGLRIDNKEIAIPSSVPNTSGGYVGLTLRAADGTAAAPSYSFTSDPDTGFWASGSNIRVSVNGVESHRFNAAAFSILDNTASIALGAAMDTILTRDAANTLAQRNSTTAQAFRVYNTFTDASNYERAEFFWSANALRIETKAAGTGTARDIRLLAGGSLLYFGTGGVEKLAVTAASFNSNSNGVMSLGQANVGWSKLYIDYTNTGTVGAVTINKAAGRVNVAAAGTSVVVTNSFVTAASKVIAIMSTADATGRVISVVPAAGSFTINTVAVTAQTSFDFFVVNAD